LFLESSMVGDVDAAADSDADPTDSLDDEL
jgi:hypothetical protein